MADREPGSPAPMAKVGSRHESERSPVATVRRRIPAAPEDVWSVLADGWSFATWVVGACRIRSVDPGWPAAGTGIHHSVGAWPALLDDHTAVEESDPPRELVLRARARPLGEARVRLLLAPDGPDATVVTMREDAIAGPGLLVPRPVRRLLLVPRNVESLRRLDLLASGRRQRAG
jgi:uncharacterized protein YndB with AHSA1/START domain